MSERPLLSEDNLIPKDGQSLEEFYDQFEWWHELALLREKFDPLILERQRVETLRLKKLRMEAARQNKSFVSLNKIDTPPLPVNFILTLIRKIVAQPEVMSAYASASLDEDIPRVRFDIICQFNRYLGYQYGMERTITSITYALMTITVRSLANKQDYTGVDDPKLRAELLTYKDICEDDGVSYE